MAANLKLSNGYEIPAFGLGTYDVRFFFFFFLLLKKVYYLITLNWRLLFFSFQCAILPKITKKSIDLGYRLFDTAYSYLNEDELGSAIKEKIEDGTVKREDVYIVTKVNSLEIDSIQLLYLHKLFFFNFDFSNFLNFPESR